MNDNDINVADDMNLTDADGVINRNTMAAPALPGKCLTTTDFGYDLAMSKLDLNPQISLFEDNIALLLQKIKDLEEEKRIERLQGEFERLQEKLAYMHNGSVSVTPRSGCSVMDQLPIAVDEHLYGSQSFGQIAGNKNVNLDTLRELSQLELAAEEKLKYQGLREDEGWQSGLYGRQALNLKGKRSGLDIVKNYCIVRHLENEYAASNLKFRDLDLRLLAAGEAEIICTTLDIIEKRGRERLFQKNMYHAGKFEWSAMLDFYAMVIKAVEFGEKNMR